MEIFTDHVLLDQVGYGRAILLTVVFGFLCCTAFLAVRAQARQLDEITALSASRQALLVDLMTASDEQQRRISEYIHDGPLQSVLMARQDITSVLKKQPSEALERAITGLKDATDNIERASHLMRDLARAGKADFEMLSGCDRLVNLSYETLVMAEQDNTLPPLLRDLAGGTDLKFRGLRPIAIKRLLPDWRSSVRNWQEVEAFVSPAE